MLVVVVPAMPAVGAFGHACGMEGEGDGGGPRRRFGGTSMLDPAWSGAAVMGGELL
jgi:hypothetical protein